MPRKAKTQSGKPAMPVNPIPPQQYGQQIATTEMQQAMPTPDNRAAMQPSGAPEPVAPANDVQAQPADLMAIAQAMSGGPGLLHQPPTPGRPLTAGQRLGPGPGPEVLPQASRGNRALDLLERLSLETMDPYFSELARKVRG
jgi:hypothetical protein